MTTTAELETVAEDGAPEPGLRVAVLGQPDGFKALPAELPNAAIEVFTSADEVVQFRPDIVHVLARGVDLGPLRQKLADAAIVVDLSHEDDPKLTRNEARRARAADRILLGSDDQLHRFSRVHPSLSAHATAVMPPLDLDWNAPLASISRVQSRDRDVKRFRRVHRLVDATVLFVGPYVPGGGLDVALDAIFELRKAEASSGLRLAAVPYGPVDHKFLAACERRALVLGHHCIIEWESVRNELPLWYALATVVCSPASAGAAALPARLAAAAGRPFVGTRGGSADCIVVDSETGFLVPPGDLAALTHSLEALIGNRDEADRLGQQARERAEQRDGEAASADWVQQVWVDAGGKATTDPDISGRLL